MLERLLEEKSPVVMFSSENAHPGRDLSSAEWKLIEQVVELLRPFKQATKEAQFRSSSISMVIPTILGLISFLEDAVTLPSFELVKGAAEDFLFDLNRRFSKSAVLENSYYVLATFLDPTYKLSCQSSGVDKKLVSLYLLEHYNKYHENNESTPTNNHEYQANVSSSAPATSSTKKKTLADYRKRLKEKSAAPSSSTDGSSLAFNSPSEEKLKKEIDNYIGMGTLEEGDDPRKWWMRNAVNFPFLSALARVYLGTPPGSVESERIFSTAGNIYSAKRNRLLPQKAEKILFCHRNLRLRREAECL